MLRPYMILPRIGVGSGAQRGRLGWNDGLLVRTGKNAGRMPALPRQKLERVVVVGRIGVGVNLNPHPPKTWRVQHPRAD
jgi:hypothetical protein